MHLGAFCVQNAPRPTGALGPGRAADPFSPRPTSDPFAPRPTGVRINQHVLTAPPTPAAVPLFSASSSLRVFVFSLLFHFFSLLLFSPPLRRTRFLDFRRALAPHCQINLLSLLFKGPPGGGSRGHGSPSFDPMVRVTVPLLARN